MVTYYDDNHAPKSSVYWWQPDLGRWVFQPTATAKAMAGLVEKRMP